MQKVLRICLFTCLSLLLTQTILATTPASADKKQQRFIFALTAPQATIAPANDGWYKLSMLGVPKVVPYYSVGGSLFGTQSIADFNNTDARDDLSTLLKSAGSIFDAIITYSSYTTPTGKNDGAGSLHVELKLLHIDAKTHINTYLIKDHHSMGQFISATPETKIKPGHLRYPVILSLIPLTMPQAENLINTVREDSEQQELKYLQQDS